MWSRVLLSNSERARRPPLETLDLLPTFIAPQTSANGKPIDLLHTQCVNCWVESRADELGRNLKYIADAESAIRHLCRSLVKQAVASLRSVSALHGNIKIQSEAPVELFDIFSENGECEVSSDE